MRALKKFLKSKGYVSVSLTLTATDHFEVMAEINGIEGRFILDTGASNTCIGTERIAFFELRPEPSEIKAAGAGATAMETFVAAKNRITIGNWERKKQKLVLFDLVHVNEALVNHKAQPVDGIIGADILKKGKAVIDYDKKRLFLKMR
ncbi:retropepsin-like aspartic protease [Flagellimonas sp. DF-77]|uniref:retropepsin-like aspartic protease family protein n=1 Tax=Flagellimonas algarum TaxID=3230298 RepID=UPI00339B5BFA